MMQLIEWLLDVLLSPWVFVPLVYPGLISAFVVLLFIIWLERKIAAKVQMRYGPLYVLKQLGGAIQLVADLLRYLFAEPIIPREADKIPFIFGPILLFALSYLSTIVIPVSYDFYAFRSDISLLLVLGITTLAPAFNLVIGWGSNNKFGLIGGLREGYLITADEIPLFITALAMAILYGSMDLIRIVELQVDWAWGIVLNPLAAVTFFVLMLLSTSRFPFEIVEAESEIVMGPFTEYSGILYGLTMGASYVKLYVLSLLFAILFLGGWEPVPDFLSEIFVGPGLILFAKALVIMFLQVFTRSVYPRYRIDQALRLAWHVLFPMSVISVFMSFTVLMGWWLP